MTRAPIACVLIAACALSLAAQTRFTARVDIVRLDALITERGKPVMGLTAADFQVYDNGVLQTVDLVGGDEVPVNAILTLDMSGSVSGQRMTDLRKASRAVLAGLKTGDQAALVSFSHVISLGADLTADFDAVRAALDRTRPGGNTSLIDAAYTGLVLGETDTGRALVIAFSDGSDTASWLTDDQVLDIGRRGNVVVYGASVSGAGKLSFLRDLTEATGGSVFQIENTKDLEATFIKILDEFRHRYLLSYSPKGVSKAGFHRLEVKVKGRDPKIKTRPGYQAGN